MIICFRPRATHMVHVGYPDVCGNHVGDRLLYELITRFADVASFKPLCLIFEAYFSVSSPNCTTFGAPLWGFHCFAHTCPSEASWLYSLASFQVPQERSQTWASLLSAFNPFACLQFIFFVATLLAVPHTNSVRMLEEARECIETHQCPPPSYTPLFCSRGTRVTLLSESPPTRPANLARQRRFNSHLLIKRANAIQQLCSSHPVLSRGDDSSSFAEHQSGPPPGPKRLFALVPELNILQSIA